MAGISDYFTPDELGDARANLDRVRRLVKFIRAKGVDANVAVELGLPVEVVDRTALEFWQAIQALSRDDLEVALNVALLGPMRHDTRRLLRIPDTTEGIGHAGT
jgi:hypothetical protein